MPAGATHLGTDLSNDHPISFNYTSALAAQRGGLVEPATLTGIVKLGSSGQLQCTSCHDAHTDTNSKFLVMSNTASALCRTCHIKITGLKPLPDINFIQWDGLLQNAV